MMYPMNVKIQITIEIFLALGHDTHNYFENAIIQIYHRSTYKIALLFGKNT
jgi:hypothetical protein